MSKTTIIYAHPYEKSFNHAILERVQALLDAKGQEYRLIDLYADGFNPVYTKEELALFREGKALDPLVLQYQQALKDSKRLIFIFPIWWADMPAIVKGFLEGRLDIDEALVISTSTAPTFYLKFVCGNFITKAMLGHTMKGVGARRRRWVNCGKANLITDEKRKAFLKGLERYI